MAEPEPDYASTIYLEIPMQEFERLHGEIRRLEAEVQRLNEQIDRLTRALSHS